MLNEVNLTITPIEALVSIAHNGIGLQLLCVKIH